METTSQLESPPLKSFRKKKRRAYPEATEASPRATTQQKYWNEYDNPSDDENADGDAFVIYCDPNQRSGFDRFWDRMAGLFGQGQYGGGVEENESQTLLGGQRTPSGDEDEMESSDDEMSAMLGSSRNSNNKALLPHHSHSSRFGTFSRPALYRQYAEERSGARFPYISHFASVCYAASLVLLAAAWILHTTGRHRYLREVHFGVLLCMVFSLMFVGLGFLAVVGGEKGRGWTVWIASLGVLGVDVVGCGGLLVWILG